MRAAQSARKAVAMPEPSRPGHHRGECTSGMEKRTMTAHPRRPGLSGLAVRTPGRRADLGDVLDRQQVADEQAEGGEQQRSDPHAQPGDNPRGLAAGRRHSAWPVCHPCRDAAGRVRHARDAAVRPDEDPSHREIDAWRPSASTAARRRSGHVRSAASATAGNARSGPEVAGTSPVAKG
jgi:hypothetical protein